MISDSELKLRLHEEIARWKKELKTEYVQGVVFGLRLALEHTEQARSDRDKKPKYRTKPQTWHGGRP